MSMRPVRTSRLTFAGLLVAAIGLVACELAGDPAFADFDAPRIVHLMPDGRILVADLGSGADDGRVVAVDLADGSQDVLLDDLPSTADSGQRYADLAGPSGAAMAPDGTVCVVIGDAAGDAYGTVRCTDGLSVDLAEFERSANPDGDEIASNPYDITADGDRGWYVTDAAANAVLYIERGGTIEVTASFGSLEPITGEATDAVPTGILLLGDDLIVALFGGAVVRIARTGEVAVLGELPSPIALAADEDGAILVLSHQDGAIIRLADGHEPETVAADLDRPTGLARLSDGRLIVAEQDAGRVRIVGEH